MSFIYVQQDKKNDFHCVCCPRAFISLFDLQVASVFQSLTDHTLAPSLVHKESKLFVNHKYPIIVPINSLKTKRRQRRLARRQKVSRERNAVQDGIKSFDHNK